ncbi:MAG TPA: hypothetical protein VGS57_01715 [Thermoanaerobaculia bacterium]|jgi:hypothetical protein|nr:hypothetical protein [Thermoanaerobaculia bacterium]
MGAEKSFAQLLRDLVAGQPGNGAGLTWMGGTPNHFIEAKAAGYGFDPASGRKELSDYLDWMWTHGHMCHAQADETFTSSHNAWHQAGISAAWYFARKHLDQPLLAQVIRYQRAELAAEELCSTPAGRVVMPGARCFLGGIDADQRSQRNRTRRLLLGQQVALPATLDTALDWTGLWILTQLERDFPGELAKVRGATVAELPKLRNALHVERGPSGHVAWFEGTLVQARPAFWAAADWTTNIESYGCDPSWKKGEKPGNLPANLPIPACPGGPGQRTLIHAAEN